MKTFNRRPFTVDIPSSSDVKNYFFNMYKFKGLVEDKNFLTVDQQSFQDTNNVYVDADGMLRSRPSIKALRDNYGFVMNMWSFSNVFITLTKGNVVNNVQKYNLNFYNTTDISTAAYVANNIFTDTNIQLKDVDNYIFVFANSAFYRYNILNSTFTSAEDYIYVPETMVISPNGVSTIVEEQNILTSKSITTYLYNGQQGIDLGINGKYFRATIDNTEYYRQFRPGTENVLVDKLSNISGRLTDTSPEVALLISNVAGTPLFIKYTYSTGILQTSATGIEFIDRATFSSPSSVTDVMVSNDGLYCILKTTRELYIISLLPDVDAGTSYRFENFTNVDVYAHLDIPPDATNLVAKFLSYNNFAYAYLYPATGGSTNYVQGIYKTGTITEVTDTKYTNLYDLMYIDNDIPVELKFNSTTYIGNRFVFIIAKETDEATPKLYLSIIDSSDTLVQTVVILTTSFNINGYNTHPIDVKLYGNTLYIAVKPSFVESYLLYTITATSNTNVRFINNTTNPELHKIGTTYVKFSTDGTRIATPHGVYVIDKGTNHPYIVGRDLQPNVISYTQHIYYTTYDTVNSLYTSDVPTSSPLLLKVTNAGTTTYIVPSHISQLDEIYLSLNNTLYITEHRKNDNDDFLWYIPKVTLQSFPSTITNLIQIDLNTMGLFLQDSIWYVKYDTEKSAYYYIKSKLDIGCANGNDVILSYDGSKIIFVCERGLVSMSYQDFVASTEQALTYLSDDILDIFKTFSKSEVKLYKYDFWIICYNTITNEGYVYDIRNESWWKMEYPTISKIVNVPVKNGNTIVVTPLILSNNKLCNISTAFDDYYDLVTTKSKISWNFVSQPLYLTDINYYKHIVNITISSIQDTVYPLSFILDTMYYKQDGTESKKQVLQYKVYSIKTFVQRLNGFKVNQFQYQLRSDIESAVQLPLNVSSITIKYKVTGQVR